MIERKSRTIQNWSSNQLIASDSGARPGPYNGPGIAQLRHEQSHQALIYFDCGRFATVAKPGRTGPAAREDLSRGRMKYGIGQQAGVSSFERLASGKTTHQALVSATALAMSLYLGIWLLHRPTTPAVDTGKVAAALEPRAPATTASVIGAVVHDLRSHAGRRPGPLAANTASPAFPSKISPEIAARRLSGEVTAAQIQTPPIRGELALNDETPAAAVVDAPAPPRRPADLKSLASRGQTQFPTRIASTPLRRTVPADQASDNRNFLEKFFDIGAGGSDQRPAGGQALAYAPQEGGMTSIAKSVLGHASTGSSTGAAVAAARYDSHTAVYDIAAKTVYLPDGTRLEAHSGLGDRLDDPRFVHERMKGPTPPHIYDLTPREALFHGVPALRLNPVGGGGAIFGRAGLLAHTYMLGPNGDSNGCVSFRDYYAFLRAYQSGQVKRLAVVAHL
jgi:hypothetical protein